MRWKKNCVWQTLSPHLKENWFSSFEIWISLCSLDRKKSSNNNSSDSRFFISKIVNFLAAHHSLQFTYELSDESLVRFSNEIVNIRSNEVFWLNLLCASNWKTNTTEWYGCVHLKDLDNLNGNLEQDMLWHTLQFSFAMHFNDIWIVCFDCLT